MIVHLLAAVALRPAVEQPDTRGEREHTANAGRFDRLAECESGGDWHANTGNGYYGGVQFAEGSWLAVHGDDFAARPDLATRTEQITAARRLLRVQDVTAAFPVCGRYLRGAA